MNNTRERYFVADAAQSPLGRTLHWMRRDIVNTILILRRGVVSCHINAHVSESIELLNGKRREVARRRHIVDIEPERPEKFSIGAPGALHERFAEFSHRLRKT
ncbi:MAG: hypothetical protein JWO71_1193 [Candidatus Acidoferrum typicum]|nr:hypothetical protein [Candidatus Acidoferrum typicum]